ncbi:MAG: glycosyltransferase [Desulfobulbaceae bacterium]|nr:glycosyltransferase [Desulfobulbaceae bacterium]
MSGRGHRVYLISDCFENKNKDVLPSGIILVPPCKTRNSRTGDFISPHHEYTYRVYDTLQELTAGERVDVAEFAEFGAEGFATIRAKRLLGKFPDTKLFVKLHTPSSLLYRINEDRRLHVDSLCDYYMEDYCVRNADVVTSPSLSLGEYFARRVGRKDIRKCPYPMELPDTGRDRTFTDKQIFTVRLIGSVQVRKGIDTFIRAATTVIRREPRFRFEIWGADRSPALFGSSYTDICQRLIPDDLRDRIVFAGSVPYREIPALFLDSCICVYPSRWENWANVCLEAMSYGCVVLVSREGGMSEMVEHGRSGYIIDPLDPHDIAEKILAVYQQPELLAELSRQARQRSLQICDPEKTATQIESNYTYSPNHRVWKNIDEEAPRVSVVIPYFNQPHYLQEAIHSVRASDYPNIEIVVVNDGSTSDPARHVFHSLDKAVVKVDKPNGGLSSARNAGIRAASGDFIVPLDADDLIEATYIRKGVETLLNNPELGYVSCHAKNFEELQNTYIPLGFVPELMPYINTHGKCCNLYRKELFSGDVWYDEVMTSYEDWDFLLTLDEFGVEGDVLPEELFFYRRHFDSMVYSTANRQRADLIQYMMIKHEKAIGPYAAHMAILLARLWKEAEIQAEHAGQQIVSLVNGPDRFGEVQRVSRARCQVYSRIGGGYWEHNSVYVDYDTRRWLRLRINLPFAGQEGMYRIDPCNKAGIVLCREIRLTDKRTGKTLFCADAKNNYAECLVSGTAELQDHPHFFVIKANGPDPQILLPELPREVPLVLSVTMYHDEASDLDMEKISSSYQAWRSTQKPLRRIWRALCRVTR